LVFFPPEPLRAAFVTGHGVGEGVGLAVGAGLGVAVGTGLGVAVGTGLGVAVGTGLGVAVGTGLGVAVGTGLGVAVGTGLGVAVGTGLGVAVGVGVGPTRPGVGVALGVAVGAGLGVAEGVAVAQLVTVTRTAALRPQASRNVIVVEPAAIPLTANHELRWPFSDGIARLRAWSMPTVAIRVSEEPAATARSPSA